jgi:hypothetical protein
MINLGQILLTKVALKFSNYLLKYLRENLYPRNNIGKKLFFLVIYDKNIQYQKN